MTTPRIDHDPAEVRRRRIAAGLNGKELAAKAGVSRTVLSSVERGTRNASPGTLRRLAVALGCAIVDLMPQRGA